MLEILFSDSACGSLKIAQHYGEGDYKNSAGCIGVILSHQDGRKPTKKEIRDARREAEEQERLAWEHAIPMGGNSADIFGFNLALSMGSITEEDFYQHRQELLERLYSPYPDGKQAAQAVLQRAKEDLKTVLDRVATGESIRIWYSNQPDEVCGLYWFMSQLQDCKGQVYLVKLPEWETDGNDTVVRRNSWGEVSPGEWHRYLALQKPVPAAFCKSCTARWKTLQQENAPLRAVLNGQLSSMPETLYDTFILREIAAEQEEFQEAVVIGRVLGNYQLGISDSWVALRIEEMLRAGKLQAVTPVTEGMPGYYRKLRKI